MRYLMRDGAPLTEGQWEQIDRAVVEEAKNILVGRRFLTLKSVGAATQNVPLDVMTRIDGASADFWGREETDAIETNERKFVSIPLVYGDFMISWRDIEDESGAGTQAARDAAVLCARREDDLIFYGDKANGIPGIFTVDGASRVQIGDWNEGESPVRDVAQAIELLVNNGCSGDRALIVSNDLYGKLHRIQPGTGVMEVERVRSLVGKLYRSNRLKTNQAALVYCDPQNMDLVVGQDMITAYMGNEKLDHLFRVMETVTPRIKRAGAIAILS